MPIRPALLWSWQSSIDRGSYLFAGIGFFLLKFAVDWTVATFAFGRSWSPLNYLVWPNDRVLRVFELDASEQTFSLTFLLISLPFICIGVSLTLQRLRAAGLPLALIGFFFVPLVNLILFLVLVLLPSREVVEIKLNTNDGIDWDAVNAEAAAQQAYDSAAEWRPEPRRLQRLRQAHQSIVRTSYWRSGAVAMAITVPLAVLSVVLGAQLLQSYGFSLFVGAPFALGMISVMLFGFSRPQPFLPCLAVGLLAALFAGVALIVIAIEGLICLIMAAPIAFMLAFFGSLVGYAIQARPWLSERAVTVMLAVVIFIPSLMAAESVSEPQPVLRSVTTEVLIEAPPERVWPLVIAFPPLAEPDDWLFCAGVAYPQRAEIRGTGVGAIRHCIFTTGTFVEPIEAWDAPRRLAFRVTEQPEPMREWSPYPIHPAHLHDYLVSRKGQFQLEPLPGGRTRLVGTTWYTNRMWPAAYWHCWSDYIIHRIHVRVLTHIQQLAEAK